MLGTHTLQSVSTGRQEETLPMWSTHTLHTRDLCAYGGGGVEALTVHTLPRQGPFEGLEP